MDFNERTFLSFAEDLANMVYNEVKTFYNTRLLNGLMRIEYVEQNPNNLKAEHKIDMFTKDLILKYIKSNYREIWDSANIYMEDANNETLKPSFLSVFIDPVDGSRSADLNIGDPCFMIAYALKNSALKFKDLAGCYVKGLKTGDIYFTYHNQSYYIPSGFKYQILPNDSIIVNEEYPMKPLFVNTVNDLSEATAIVRDGYGFRKVVAEKINHDILNRVKHCFCHDITGMELCYLASGRNIADIIVEARSHVKNDKPIGSDAYNLIPYPLIKASGAMLYTLNGQNFDDLDFNPTAIYDFIACTGEKLLKEFLKEGVR